MNSKIISFTDLDVWREGHVLVLLIYKTCDSFPKKEMYGLNSQMCRAATSITSNIAEGFARRTYKEKLRFYNIALGSLMELQNQLLIARDVLYVDENTFKIVSKHTVRVQMILNAFITKTKTLTVRDSKFETRDSI